MKQCKHVTALARGEDTSKGEKITCECIFEPPPLLTRRGRFLSLDGPAGKVYTSCVKGCVDGPRPRITDGTS